MSDTTILGDVWMKYGAKPQELLDLLITPQRTVHADELAAAIDDGLECPPRGE